MDKEAGTISQEGCGLIGHYSNDSGLFSRAFCLQSICIQVVSRGGTAMCWHQGRCSQEKFCCSCRPRVLKAGVAVTRSDNILTMCAHAADVPSPKKLWTHLKCSMFLMGFCGLAKCLEVPSHDESIALCFVECPRCARLHMSAGTDQQCLRPRESHSPIQRNSIRQTLTLNDGRHVHHACEKQES